MLIEKMESSGSLDIIAIYDSEFHQKLFSIAEREEFFTWFRLQSKKLSTFLSGFWKAIGFQTRYYYELLSVHKEIYHAVEIRDCALAVRMMEKHFSILLLQLLSTMFDSQS